MCRVPVVSRASDCLHDREASGAGGGDAGVRGRPGPPPQLRVAEHLRDQPSRHQRRVRSDRGPSNASRARARAANYVHEYIIYRERFGV